MKCHSNYPLFETEYRPHRDMAEPSVFIPAHVHAKIMTWVDAAPGEVSGLGKVTQKDGVFTVTEVYLLPQKNSGASTEMDAASVAKLMYESRETPGHLNFWWHSHVNMDCFWSGTDIATIQDMGQHGWLLSTVFNKKREQRSALYVKATEVIPELFIDDISLEIGNAYYSDKEKWLAEYKEKCKPAHEPTDYGWPDWTDYRGWNGGEDTYTPKGGIRSKLLPTVHPLKGKPIQSATLQDAEDLMEDCETEPNAKIATQLLGDACRVVEQHQSLTNRERKSLKKEYIERFNLSRLEHKEMEGFSQ